MASLSFKIRVQDSQGRPLPGKALIATQVSGTSVNMSESDTSVNTFTDGDGIGYWYGEWYNDHIPVDSPFGFSVSLFDPVLTAPELAITVQSGDNKDPFVMTAVQSPEAGLGEANPVPSPAG
jgi:hypothetical protein